ncbi:MAG: diguanylate cyclase [Rhodocyclaceae bacterium]|nr:MAG: diguanylate cyclase [Rhodocyclaceae bacterium]
MTAQNLSMLRHKMGPFGLLLALILLPLLPGTLFLSKDIAEESTRRHWAHSEQIADNAARAIDASISSAVRMVDLSLDSIVARLALMGTSPGLNAETLSPLIQAYLERQPELDSIHITDAEGMIRWGSGTGLQASPAYIAASFLSSVRSQTGGGATVITSPYMDQISKRWVLAFLRRYDRPDGNFGGVVSIGIPLSHLEKLLSNQNLGERGSAVLRDKSSGALIARHPASGLPIGQVGDAHISPELREFIESSVSQKVFFAPLSKEGPMRLTLARKLDQLPFLIIADVSSDGPPDTLLERSLNNGFLLLIPLSSLLLAVHLTLESRARRKRDRREIEQLATQLKTSQNEMHQLTSSLERQVQERTEKIRLAASIVENTSEGAIVTDSRCVILAVNPAFEAITGYTAKEVIGNTPHMLKSDRQGPQFYRRLWQNLLNNGHWSGELWNRHKNGDVYLERLTINAISGEGIGTRYVGIFTNVTDRYQNEKRLRHLAFHDALTGLANRALIMDRLEHALERSKRSGTSLAVMLFDLDGFKAVNDRFGHEVGDLLLQEVARCVGKRVRRGSDTLARLGGDEFLVLLEDVRSLNSVPLLAEQIVSDIAGLNDIRGCAVKIGASVGIANFPEAGVHAAELVKSADDAMYQAKEAGKGCFVVFKKTKEDGAGLVPQE